MLGVPVSGPLANFGSDAIFLLKNLFILTNACKKLRYDRVVMFFVSTGFFQNFLTKISNCDKILNFELLAVYFCMQPTIMYCLKVVSSKPQKTSSQKDWGEGGTKSAPPPKKKHGRNHYAMIVMFECRLWNPNRLNIVIAFCLSIWFNGHSMKYFIVDHLPKLSGIQACL